MKTKILFLAAVLVIMTTSGFGQTQQDNFKIFDAQGKPATFENLMTKIGGSDVVFLGEQHDDQITHAVQSAIFEKANEQFQNQRRIFLSLEMFERDTQTVLDEYLSDLITEKKFLDDSRPWNNYKTDYRPLIEYAKQNKIAVVAANAPRRYVNMVSRGGRTTLERLSPEAKKWLAPLPYPAPSAAYAAKFRALMGGSGEANMGLDNILGSQSLWDATMADSIAKTLNSAKNPLIIHLNGAFHTENRLGTAEQLLNYRPKTKILVVTMRPVENYTTFDVSKYENLGDFVILTKAAK